MFRESDSYMKKLRIMRDIDHACCRTEEDIL